MLNIAHASVTQGVNGPGRRFTVWVQGCPRDCPGCFNPELRADRPGRRVASAALAREALAQMPWEGVTLSGGEPFSQAKALAEFLVALRDEAPACTAIAFSGHTLEELAAGPAQWRRLLAGLDLLVDGPYQAARAADLPLRGSANQRLVALTPAGLALRAQVLAQPAGASFAVAIDAAGEVILSGFPPPAAVEALRARPIREG